MAALITNLPASCDLVNVSLPTCPCSSSQDEFVKEHTRYVTYIIFVFDNKIIKQRGRITILIVLRFITIIPLDIQILIYVFTDFRVTRYGPEKYMGSSLFYQTLILIIMWRYQTKLTRYKVTWCVCVQGGWEGNNHDSIKMGRDCVSGVARLVGVIDCTV